MRKLDQLKEKGLIKNYKLDEDFGAVFGSRDLSIEFPDGTTLRLVVDMESDTFGNYSLTFDIY